MKNNIILLALSILVLMGCKEDMLTIYEGESDGRSGLFIQLITSGITGTNFETYSDSSGIYSFVGRADSITYIYGTIPVRVLGNVQPYNRSFKMKAITELCVNAKEGIDFEIDHSKCVIEAGKASLDVPIKFIRTVHLKDKMATVVIEIEENENFMIPFTTYRSANNPNVTNAKMLSATRFKLFTSEIYSKPRHWDTFMTGASVLLGAWTPTKFNTLNVFMGWKPENWNNPGASGNPIQSGRMAYCALMFQKHLQAAANSGKPVHDEDSESGYMQLADPYLVDYSKNGK